MLEHESLLPHPAKPHPKHHRQARFAKRLLIAMLLLVPVVVMVISISPTGRSWFSWISKHPENSALIPGMTLVPDFVNFTSSKNTWYHSDTKYLVVTSLQSDSEAALQGVSVGDTVISLNGHPIFSLDQARTYLQDGNRVRIRVVHQNQIRDLDLEREVS